MSDSASSWGADARARARAESRAAVVALLARKRARAAALAARVVQESAVTRCVVCLGELSPELAAIGETQHVLCGRSRPVGPYRAHLRHDGPHSTCLLCRRA